MSLHFGPATTADEPALHALFAATPMPGAVSLVQARQPDFWAADGVLGDEVQTLVARDAPDGPPLALLQRGVRRVWLEGRSERVAYLGGLRVHPAHRGRGISRLGWAAVNAWHVADPVALTFVAFTAESRAARRVFVEKPGGLDGAQAQRFTPLASLVTLALPVGRPRRLAFGIETGEASPPPPRDLAPVRPPPYPGLAPEDQIALRRGGRPLAAGSVWDPTPVRQTLVESYGRALALARPALNRLAPIGGLRPLPPEGGALRSAFAVGLHARDPPALNALVDALLARCHARGLAFLLVGMDARDPLLPALRRRLHVPYRSTLHAIVWPDDPDPTRLRRPVHAEIATY